MAFTQNTMSGTATRNKIVQLEFASDTAGTATEVITFPAQSFHSANLEIESLHSLVADNEFGAALGQNIKLNFTIIGLGAVADWTSVDELLNGTDSISYARLTYDDGRTKTLASGDDARSIFYFKSVESDDGENVKEIRIEAMRQTAYVTTSAS